MVFPLLLLVVVVVVESDWGVQVGVVWCRGDVTEVEEWADVYDADEGEEEARLNRRR